MQSFPSLYQIIQVNKAAHYHQNSYLPDGYKLFYSSDVLKLSKKGYYGVSAINQKDKQIIICSAGTQISDIHDLISDIQIFNNEIPKQHKYALKFTEHCLANMPGNYNITITGFSLGAVLADLTSFKMSSKYPSVNSITFENPGSLELVLKYFVTEILDLSTVFKTFNSAVPNLINSFATQIGETYNVCLNSNKFSDDMGKLGNALLAGHIFKNFADGAFTDNQEIRLCGKDASTIETITNLMEFL